MLANPTKTRVLVVDDDPEICELMSTFLVSRGYAPLVKGTVEDGLASLHQEDVDIVITDLFVSERSGLDICRAVKQSHPNIPVIVMTGFGDVQCVAEAMRAGASDFIVKPFAFDSIEAAIQRVGERTRLNPVHMLAAEVRHFQGYDRLIGHSRAMRSVHELIVRASPSDATVFIAGESGTGKELVARAVHAASRRSDKPFVAINCAAMPEQLLESELFGHTRGAFTDAKGDRRGLFIEADGGTLFLDEISEMPLAMQVKLLRALQERMVRPVGGNEEVRFDVRIIAATNRNIDKAVEEGKFRADLFYRLNVVRIDVPPLRQRGRDIEELAISFVARHPDCKVSTISPEAMEKLMSYSFPGNVRELENIIARACALASSAEIQDSDLPESVRQYKPTANTLPSAAIEDLLPMDKVEKRYISQVLAAVQGNKTHAAHVLEIDRKTLTRKLQRWKAAEARSRAMQKPND